MFEKRIVYSLPAMERIAPRNLVYRDGPDGQQLADLYLPPGTNAASAVVIFIHGGMPEGVTAKDGGVFVSWGQLMAASGIAGVAFNHRLRWENGYVPASLANAAQDLQELMQFLRTKASTLNVDPERVCLLAFSAGGPLLAAALRDRPCNIKCIAGLYTYLGEPLPGSTDAGRFSPLDALEGGTGSMPPIFLGKAGKDYAMMNDSIDAFDARARQLGASVELMLHPEGLHAFDILNDDDTSRAIIRRTAEFIGSHLR